MANVDNPNGFTFVRSLYGHAELAEGTLKISETIAKGDALIESATAGQLGIALSNSGLLHGIAAEAKVTGAGATAAIKYYPALPGNIFEGQCSGTFATTHVFTPCDIEGTTGIMEVNEDATTESVIYIIGYNPNSEVGANTRVYFIIIRSSFYPVLAAV